MITKDTKDTKVWIHPDSPAQPALKRLFAPAAQVNAAFVPFVSFVPLVFPFGSDGAAAPNLFVWVVANLLEPVSVSKIHPLTVFGACNGYIPNGVRLSRR